MEFCPSADVGSESSELHEIKLEKTSSNDNSLKFTFEFIFFFFRFLPKGIWMTMLHRFI